MLELSDKNFKATITNMLQQAIRNTLETKANRTAIICNTFMTAIDPLQKYIFLNVTFKLLISCTEKRVTK